MDIPGDHAPIEEIIEFGFLGIESANRLQVLYLFEKRLYFTDIFRLTMEAINSIDGIWDAYIAALDEHKEPHLNDPLDEPIRKMAEALIKLHIDHLELTPEVEDWENTVAVLTAILDEIWDIRKSKWTRDRKAWFTTLSTDIPIKLR